MPRKKPSRQRQKLEQAAKEQPSPGAKPRSGPPRFDPYLRYFSRFYEALIFVIILGVVRGDRITRQEEPGSRAGTRRRFLSNLAFVCEYEKGGDAVTAIGIENSMTRYIFWVGCNSNASEKIVQFLRSILHQFRDSLHPEQQQARDDMTSTEELLIKKCTQFSQKRVKKETVLLRRDISRCIDHLRTQGSGADLELAEWLGQFQDMQGQALCNFAYDCRKSRHMEEIGQRSQEPTYKTGADDISSSFQRVRHYIGRLAHHVRAPKQLWEDFSSSHLADIFDGFEVCAVPFLQSVPAPEPDGMTTLDHIIKRMLPSHSDELQSYQAALTEMDRKFHLFDKVLEKYRQPDFAPRVHAEIQVLEHFYKEKLAFADSDKFIACSKPACFCCQLYIRNHPLKCVEPESHQKVWLNWGPPVLPSSHADPSWPEQRGVLDSVLKEIRRNACEQIKERRGSYPWHADSHTGITESVDRAALEQAVERIDVLSITTRDDSTEQMSSEDHVGSEQEADSDTEGGVSL